ncbi:TniQ family protein [Pseudoalteromonas phenolica]|uniref:TniQ family protein n=1 Tax=Pseudoalteromonas phenolica TaxID=161398 RepID=UPI000717688B|nr:TniQ family protein [Pseudoalteromonas phenolica]MBE0354505.1 hypothetical protein [Pseudoalteromonas phenolica O-BC30]RXE96009.1 hypothetical protein D9981_13370 [Pseudoalteromonas phenolica O-BC30]
MIPFYLSLLPGEHIYSWCARSFWLSGIYSKNDYLKKIGIKSIEMLPNLPMTKSSQKTCFFAKQYNESSCLGSIATTYPLWVLSVNSEKYNNTLAGLNRCTLKTDLHVARQSGISHMSSTWKACPNCTQEDLDKFGSSYWHVQHQLSGIFSCYKHGCTLQTPKERLTNLSCLLLPHQIEFWSDVAFELSEIQIEFSEFLHLMYNFALKDANELTQHKDKFWQLFNINGSNLSQKVAMAESIESEFVSDLGITFLSSIFSYYLDSNKTNRRKVINTIIASDTQYRYLDPTFWAVVLFWKREQLGLSQKISNACASYISSI